MRGCFSGRKGSKDGTRQVEMKVVFGILGNGYMLDCVVVDRVSMLVFRKTLVLGGWSEGFVSTKIALQVNKLEKIWRSTGGWISPILFPVTKPIN